MEMGKKVRFLLIVLALVAVAAGIVWHFSHLTKPLTSREQEQIFEAWLTNGGTGFPRGQYWSRTTPKEIGPWAYPLIVQALDRSDSPWVNRYRDLWPRLPRLVQKYLPAPKPASFSHVDASQLFWRACCNPVGATLLVKGLKDRNPAVREAVCSALLSVAGKFLSTNEVITAYLPALNDPDIGVRLSAAHAVGRFGPAASNAVPKLITLLQNDENGWKGPFNGTRWYVRANAAIALANIGPAAANALPALEKLMANGDSFQRVASAFAIWRISSNADITLPVLISEMPTFEPGMKWMPARAFQEMGPRAKAALPVLEHELNKATDPFTISDITNALKAIDPNAAANLGIK